MEKIAQLVRDVIENMIERDNREEMEAFVREQLGCDAEELLRDSA